MAAWGGDCGRVVVNCLFSHAWAVLRRSMLVDYSASVALWLGRLLQVPVLPESASPEAALAHPHTSKALAGIPVFLVTKVDLPSVVNQHSLLFNLPPHQDSPAYPYVNIQYPQCLVGLMERQLWPKAPLPYHGRWPVAENNQKVIRTFPNRTSITNPTGVGL